MRLSDEVRFFESEQKYIYWERKVGKDTEFWSTTIQLSPRVEIGKNRIAKDKSNYVLIRKWGTIGKAQQSVTIEFENLDRAIEELNKMIWIKEKEGFVGVF